MNINKNDYIIKGVNGEFYPCKPDIFIKTYKEIEDEQSCCSTKINNAKLIYNGIKKQQAISEKYKELG